ncbi:MAG: hypothetical protein HOM58_03150 [Rhodospirillaceae bacterium]|jgi:hypothetical protein|nr:hypothetical protein [Rhodospirillaceae bacterium]MBT5456452.1 hypothetical protein [Rhodospirillaceae bacterium]
MYRLLLIAVILTALSGCGKFIYDHKFYQTREEAFAAAQSDIATKISEVAADPKRRIGGSVLVAIPQRQVIERYGVRKAWGRSRGHVPYVADVLELGFLGMAEVIRNAMLFDRVDVIRPLNSSAVPFDGYDFKLWLTATDLEQWQWLFLKSGFRDALPVARDQSFFGEVKGVDSFNDSIHKAYLEFNSPSVDRGKGSGGR